MLYEKYLELYNVVCVWTRSVSGEDDGGEVDLEAPWPDESYAVSSAGRSAGRVHGKIWQGARRGFSLWYVVYLLYGADLLDVYYLCLCLSLYVCEVSTD